MRRASWSRGRGSRRSGCSRAPGAARSSAPSAGRGVAADLALVDDRLLVAEEELDRVLDGQDVAGAAAGCAIRASTPAWCSCRCRWRPPSGSGRAFPAPAAPAWSGTFSVSSGGITAGCSGTRPPCEPRCLKAERRKLPTRATPMPRFSSPVSSSSSSCCGVSISASSWRGCVGVSSWSAQLQDLAVDLDQHRHVGRQEDVRRALLRHQAQHPFHVAAHAICLSADEQTPDATAQFAKRPPRSRLSPGRWRRPPGGEATAGRFGGGP
jgi:hypothetical protein